MDKYGLPRGEYKSPRRWNVGLAIICGCLAPVLFPPLHIGILYYFWEDFHRSVDKHFCTCSCWDTVFKGTYESGVAAYKHLYFNATSNTLKIWMLTVASMIALYECLRYLTLLALTGQLRFSMLILFLSSVFAHYYSWWAYVNYWNDDYYSQWYHQLFFTATEVFSTIFVVHLAHVENSVTARKALSIVGIAVIHVLAGGWDQFIANVVRGEGYSHQVLRDLGFMIPDMLHVCLPLSELRRNRKERSRLHLSDFLGFVVLVSLGFLVGGELLNQNNTQLTTNLELSQLNQNNTQLTTNLELSQLNQNNTTHHQPRVIPVEPKQHTTHHQPRVIPVEPEQHTTHHQPRVIPVEPKQHTTHHQPRIIPVEPYKTQLTTNLELSQLNQNNTHLTTNLELSQLNQNNTQLTTNLELTQLNQNNTQLTTNLELSQLNQNNTTHHHLELT